MMSFFFPRIWCRLLVPGLLLAGGMGESAVAQRIRIAAANISSGNGQDYDPGHGIRILQGVKPDIILIQEFNYLNNTGADIRAMVDTVCGPGFHYFRESGSGNIPNGIISRYPLLASGQWVSTVAERDYAWARIDLPGSRELLAVSVHLPTTDSRRPAEALDLVGYINAYYAADGGSRATDYLVIGGDFNTDTRTETCLNASHLGQVVTVGTSHPADQAGDTGTNAARSKPYDAVYAGKGLHGLLTPTVIGNSAFPHGLVVDTRVYTPLAEIAPALTGDSGAVNMQHMAVVRDFQLPLPADPPVLELLSTQIRSAAPRSVGITFRSTAGATYEAQASASITMGSWVNLGTFVAAGTSATVTVVPSGPVAGQVADASLATAPRRFYRIVRR